MEGFCTRCGDCCENIAIPYTEEEVAKYRGIYQKWVDYYKEYPDFEPTEDGQPSKHMAESNLESMAFADDYWHSDGEYFHCDWWDSVSRTCTAHDKRPPICEKYPWYGNMEEYIDKPDPLGYSRCGYWYDVPQDKWPDGVRLLPIV